MKSAGCGTNYLSSNWFILDSQRTLFSMNSVSNAFLFYWSLFYCNSTYNGICLYWIAVYTGFCLYWALFILD
jgi:hypothetical protein